MQGRLLCILSAVLLAISNAANFTYDIDTSSRGRRHDGVGAISGGGATSRLLRDYPAVQRSQILDYLFLPSFGASLSILKVEIGGEVESTNGAEPSHRRSATDLGTARGYEWELMVEARRRNPEIKLYALAWGWPGYLRNGTNATEPFSDYGLTAAYLTSWLDVARGSYNLTVDYLGVWNECYFGPYDFIPFLRAALDAAGYSSTQLVVADDYVNRWGIVSVLAANETIKAAVSGVGVHYPGATSPPAAQALGLPLWASEDDSSGSLNGGACLARAVNENYANGLMTATITWHLVSAFYPSVPWFGDSLISAGWPTSGAYAVNYALWAAAHTAQFMRPGWTYLAHGVGVGYLQGGGTFVAATDGAGAFTLVAEKLSRATSQCLYAASPPNATAPEVATFNGLGAFPLLHVWASNFSAPAEPDALFRYAGTVAPDAKGSVTLPLGIGAVVTLTTLSTGAHGNYSSPPKPAPFPLPYADSFAGYALESEAAYFSDMSGAFEVVDASAFGRPRAMQQVTPEPPIGWQRPNYAPHTIIGDTWLDVAANVSVLLSDASHTAALGVRTQQIDTMSGVWLAVNGSTWGIWSSIQALAAGGRANFSGALPVSLRPGTWHSLSLVAASVEVVEALVDGTVVATANVSAFPKGGGWVALGTAAYGQDVMFADFSVAKPAAS